MNFLKFELSEQIMPIEIHEESFTDAELQVRFLIQSMKGCKIDALLPLLNGSFSHWIWRKLGIPVSVTRKDFSLNMCPFLNL
jgi:hypothetical protein